MTTQQNDFPVSRLQSFDVSERYEFLRDSIDAGFQHPGITKLLEDKDFLAMLSDQIEDELYGNTKQASGF